MRGLILFLVLSVAWGNKSVQEQQAEEVNFGSIKNILANDFLQKSADKKSKKFKRVKQRRIRTDRSKYDYPKQQHFWSFFSELWLVRNAQRLQWDFEHPDYGLDKSLQEILSKFGFLEQRFKLLLLNNKTVTHMALPANRGEIIWILSAPFIRALDLTKREIGILLMEDYIRLQSGYFLSYIKNKKLQGLIGGNFWQKKADISSINEALKRADHFIYHKGFSFQQQFRATQKISEILKSHLPFWNSYLSLLRKIDHLVKSNESYQNYTKIYPAPEIQIKWLIPKKKVL